MKELNSIYSEIEDYNQNYQSKYLFWVWTLFATIINTYFYLGLFSNANFIMRLIFIIASTVFIFVLILMINCAFSVNLKVNKSYQLIYSLSLNKRKLMSNRMLFKVFVLVKKFSKSSYEFSNNCQVSIFIERINHQKIGFYRYKLFVINYFRGYEVSFFSYYQ